jgi:hypothetical protein
LVDLLGAGFEEDLRGGWLVSFPEKARVDGFWFVLKVILDYFIIDDE